MNGITKNMTTMSNTLNDYENMTANASVKRELKINRSNYNRTTTSNGRLFFFCLTANGLSW